MLKRLFYKKTIESMLADPANSAAGGAGLHRVLTVRDLTFFGIAAIIGAGSFSALGSAIYSGGPGVVALYVICGIACGFTALCYSDFASRIPIAGSAYTYAYATFGELFAWIIGWALIMEYSISNVYLAFSWSKYMGTLLPVLGIHLPLYLQHSYLEVAQLQSGALQEVWASAPMFFGKKIIFDLPACIINILITALVYRGIRTSRNFSNAMVAIKLSIICLVLLVIGYMLFRTDAPLHWHPLNAAGEPSFFPNYFSGVMMAVSSVFFAYIGFDAVSVLAEESKNPQRDLPRGIIYSLVVCTVIYILLALALTGAVPYHLFKDVKDPLAFVFSKENLNLPWMETLVAICAVAAMMSVMLVMQASQPRIWMTMGRDGLLPRPFKAIHPRYQTPHIATIITGLFVGALILGTESKFVLEFTSTGTLFAFALVCGGVLFLPQQEKQPGRFHLPFVGGRYIYPALVSIGFIAFILQDAPWLVQGTFHVPFAFFWLFCSVLVIMAVLKNLSLIPLMGLTSCLYLLTYVEPKNWKWFFLWFGIGLVVYFGYGFRRSDQAAQ